jgi:rSAM/selenodomain-associated transferase 1
VKTRLASSIGVERAAGVYRTLVEHQLAEIPQAGASSFTTPSDAEPNAHGWKGFRVEGPISFRNRRRLGVRLTAAMDHGFASGADPGLFLGGDCPGTTCSYLEEAEAALAKTDMVITGALDGGYVLLGLWKPMAAVFEAIPWSSGSVFSATLSRARAAGLTYECLSSLEDVDDLESYERQRKTIQDLVRASSVL